MSTTRTRTATTGADDEEEDPEQGDDPDKKSAAGGNLEARVAKIEAGMGAILESLKKIAARINGGDDDEDEDEMEGDDMEEGESEAEGDTPDADEEPDDKDDEKEKGKEKDKSRDKSRDKSKDKGKDKAEASYVPSFTLVEAWGAGAERQAIIHSETGDRLIRVGDQQPVGVITAISGGEVTYRYAHGRTHAID